MSRQDDHLTMAKHEGRYAAGKALVVLGGPSAAGWDQLYSKLLPDVLIGVNGVNQMIPWLDYWLCAENMRYPFEMSQKGVERWVKIMKMYYLTGASYRLVNYKSADIVPPGKDLIRIQRSLEADPYVPEVDLAQFTFRKYGGGLLNGPRMERPEIVKDLRCGTVGLQAIHLAGLLGCSEIHTIGYDMCYPEGEAHHWYKYPPYVGTKFYGKNMFTEHKGLNTMWFWIDTVNYLKKIEPVLEKDGIIWKDHSSGLIQLEGLKASKEKGV